MKSVFKICKTVCLSFGAIVGAGYLSGAELVCFFGAKGYAVGLIVSCVAFIVGYGLSVAVKTAQSKLLRFATTVSLFITFSAMLAVTDSVFPIKLNGKNLPVFSVVTVVLSVALTKNGIKSVEKFNSALSPIVIAGTVASLIFFGTPQFGGRSTGVGFAGFEGIIKAISFSLSNVFLSYSQIKENTENFSIKEKIIAIVVSSVAITAFAFFILACVSDEYALTENPLIYSVDGSGKKILSVCVFLASFGSAVTFFYPLRDIVRKYGKTGLFSLCSLALVFSFLGVTAVIKYAYPVIGVFGGILVFKNLVVLSRSGRIKFSGLTIISRIKGERGTDMSNKNKKKNKVVKLTEEDYNNYVMAMKDEKPPVLIRKNKPI